MIFKYTTDKSSFRSAHIIQNFTNETMLNHTENLIEDSSNGFLSKFKQFISIQELVLLVWLLTLLYEELKQV